MVGVAEFLIPRLLLGLLLHDLKRILDKLDKVKDNFKILTE